MSRFLGRLLRAAGRLAGSAMPLFLACDRVLARNLSDPVFSWDAFGVAYAYFIACVVLAGLLYMFFRWQIVLNPGAITRRYAVAVQLIGLLYVIASILENAISDNGTSNLPYESLPLIGFVIIVHYLADREEQPAVLIFAFSLVIAIMAVGFVALSMGWVEIRPGQWVIGAVGAGMVGYTLAQTTRTKKSYIGRAAVERKVSMKRAIPGVRAWLSVEQWVALAVASLVVAAVTQTLAGSSLLSVPARRIFYHMVVLLGGTLIIGLLYSGLHWLLSRRSAGELAWVLWMVWILIAFASTYGMFLVGRSV